MKRWICHAAIAVFVIALAPLFAPAGATAATTTQPWVIVLCKFTDRQAEPHGIPYYQDMFANADKGGLADYWRDVSYGQLSMAGTIVKGWYTLPTTSYEYDGWNRSHKANSCAAAANNDVDFSKYHGVLSIVNHPQQPDPPRSATLAAAIDGDDTTITVSNPSAWPAPPYPAHIDKELLHVTAVNGNTWTVQRGHEGSPVAGHAAGAAISLTTGADLFGTGPGMVNLDGKALSAVVAAEDISVVGIAHELGHGFSFQHSRKLSSSTEDYNDCYDIMSAFGCVHTFSGADFGVPRQSGPGLNAINLDRKGWLAADRKIRLDSASCTPKTIQLASLSHAEAAGYLQATTPATVTIATPPDGNGQPTSTTSDYYSVEFRSKTGWDAGIPADSVLMHLHGKDQYSYWVDRAGTGGALTAGSVFADPAQRTYLAVNAIDATNFTATVTLAGCKIPAAVTYTGATSATYLDRPRLAATVTIAGTSTPIPGAEVSFELSGSTCTTHADAAGKAECTMTASQKPGAYSVKTSYAGNEVYTASSVSTPFTIAKAPIAMEYTGETTAPYHHAATVSAKLLFSRRGAVPTGNIAFQLGASDTCTGVIDDLGAAACTITPTQAAGDYPLTASFAGDDYYLPSSTSATFVITKQATALAYTGDARLANGTPARMVGVLKEDLGAPISGRWVTFTIGTGASAQSCGADTDSTGTARCVIDPVAQPLTSSTEVPVRAVFEPDPFYLGSSAAGSLPLQYFTGRAYGLSATIKLPLLPLTIAPTPDTGQVRTASAQTTPTRCSTSVGLLVVTAHGLCANVTTTLNPGTMTSTASVADVRIGLPGLPVIELRGVQATSRTSCTAATGSTVLTLSIGGVARQVSLAPNSTIDLGVAKLVLNEQKPVPGSDRGLAVTGAHLTLVGGSEVVIAATTSATHNC
jgi:hypothetical protein